MNLSAENKQKLKQTVRRLVGEPYVGKRLKMHRMNRVMPELKLTPSDILDAGSEDATFAYWLADRYPGAKVTATDIDAAAIAACEAARPPQYQGRVGFRVARFDELADESYDLVTAFDVLEHIPDDIDAIAQLFRVLRPGGTLLVHVPRDRWRTASGEIIRVPDDEAWKINSGHVRSGYDPERLGQLVRNAGFRVERTETWLGEWGVRAHSYYARVERFIPLRATSIPVSDVCARLDVRRSSPEVGNTVFLVARKPN